MKTTSAIQKSRSVEQYIKWSDEKELDIDARDMSIEFFTFHITTSQKDIFSALIKDMEELESHLHLMSKEEIPQAEAKGYRQALKDTQDIIRKAREV